ncbi:MAG: ABC transporter permease [Rhodospirillales bacterium]|jgi:His/Glu/Gln/Arg/opine family amino acid ABC transporter permease subunit|nr:ABC transporter permease [Rhodospirillales bacterium]MBT4038458.1 ABC transporter permease [Rhodospirillales bacterium]MBT4627368.1 ABC transporter permease [Rhodospirillales bacterium]MBT5350910.1 ABC transporter permease [Rhodospirillales bacterium]MBT5519846.1 ABC transporter permease [Rhodospirillales bacterium]
MEAIFDYRQLLLDGTLVTIRLAIVSAMLAVVLGLIGAWAKLSKSRAAQTAAGAYTTLIRGVPDLVLMLLIFYGGQTVLNNIGDTTGLWGYVEISQFTAGVGTIGFIFGAYYTETFRGAILAIPVGQIEAAKAYGMMPWQIFTRVIWPQMVRYALPGFTNNWLVQLKSTALVSVIGIQDLVYNAFGAGRSVRQLFTFMFAVLVIYLIMTAVSDAFLRWIDRKYSAGVREA